MIYEHQILTISFLKYSKWLSPSKASFCVTKMSFKVGIYVSNTSLDERLHHGPISQETIVIAFMNG